MDSLISVIALIISLISVLITSYFASRAKKDREIQVQLELFSEIREYRHALRKWGFDAIDAISDAIFLCDFQTMSKDELKRHHHEVLLRLSSEADKGRLFIPNVYTEEFGTHKPEAYKGFREPILDVIIEVYDLLRTEYDFERQDNFKLFNKLWELRREFVSELQKMINPRELEQQLRDLSQTMSSSNRITA